uniref:WD_REPEATS_REGION domain-containing protein n=1 Tax=Macrostomum lignano TaxID=282301 RepID=A0A1I8GL37_9PLAT
MRKGLRNVKGVFDGIRAIGGSQTSKSDLESLDFEENLKSEHFNVSKIVCHGFPNAPCCIAFDPIQKLLAIGTKHGSIRILGRAGVDCHLRLEKEETVKQLIFIINEGGLISIESDNTISLWTIRQKRPTVTLQMQFNKREDVSQAYLPFQSKFVYIGTTQGNVYLMNIETFRLSGYIINWNKVIGMLQSVHPGAVAHIAECPVDSNKLLIGFRKGLTVLWDLQKREALRFKHTEDLCSVSWHHEGRMFISSHIDGSLVKWSLKNPQKPEVTFPHANLMEADGGSPTSFRPIQRVFWLNRRRENADLFLFSGGSPLELSQPCVNIQLNNHIDVLQMEHDIVDIVPMCDTPFNNDIAEPYAVAVLQKNDLAVIDLTSDGYPNFENPYPMDLHESPVTACHYVADCPHKLIESFFMVGRSQKHSEGFSTKQWPVTGGEWGDSKTSYSEILVTGHADGSLKFWDASLLELQALYRLRTSKYFEPGSGGSKPTSRQVSSETTADPAAPASGGTEASGGANWQLGDEALAVQLISFDADFQRLLVAGTAHVCLLSFSRREVRSEIMTVELCVEQYDDSDLHEDFSRISGSQQQQQQQQQQLAAGSPKQPPDRRPPRPRFGSSSSRSSSPFHSDVFQNHHAKILE